ncbi:MAG: JAB domain-containing protein [Patescibacteria group bacterium]
MARHHHGGERRQLADRLLLTGAEFLSEAELLGLALHHTALGHALASQTTNWSEADRTLIGRVPGLSTDRLASLYAMSELAKRFAVRPLYLSQSLHCSEAVVNVYRPKLALIKQEVFVAISLNNRNCVVAEHTIAKGSLDSVNVHPREVFRPLLRDAAARAIALHNHPSGDPTPSENDISMCRRLHEVGKLVGIPLLDFLIVAHEGSVSFRDIGLMPAS